MHPESYQNTYDCLLFLKVFLSTLGCVLVLLLYLSQLSVPYFFQRVSLSPNINPEVLLK